MPFEDGHKDFTAMCGVLGDEIYSILYVYTSLYLFAAATDNHQHTYIRPVTRALATPRCGHLVLHLSCGAGTQAVICSMLQREGGEGSTASQLEPPKPAFLAPLQDEQAARNTIPRTGIHDPPRFARPGLSCPAQPVFSLPRTVDAGIVQQTRGRKRLETHESDLYATRVTARPSVQRLGLVHLDVTLGLVATAPLAALLPPLATDPMALGGLPGAQDQVDRLFDADAVLHHGAHHRPALAHPLGLELHQVDVGAHGARQVALVDDEQIGARDAGPALARHLVAARNVDDVDDEVGQLARVVGGQIVAAALDQQQVRGELGLQALQRQQVGADVLAHGGVRAAARLDGDDALGRQRAVLGQELGVLAREDVVGHGRDVVRVA